MFEWSNEFSVSIPMFDDQHQHLFEIGSAILKLMENSSEESFYEILEQVTELANYTKYHFLQEEKLMIEYAFPELEEHQEEHRKFVEYLDQITFSEIMRDQNAVLQDLIRYIEDWILNHIKITDMKYGEYLTGKMK